jgi:hypothetical protein
MSIDTNVTCLELVATEHNDIPVDHRYSKALFFRFTVRLGVRI